MKTRSNIVRLTVIVSAVTLIIVAMVSCGGQPGSNTSTGAKDNGNLPLVTPTNSPSPSPSCSPNSCDDAAINGRLKQLFDPPPGQGAPPFPAIKDHVNFFAK